MAEYDDYRLANDDEVNKMNSEYAEKNAEKRRGRGCPYILPTRRTARRKVVSLRRRDAYIFWITQLRPKKENCSSMPRTL